MKLLLVLTMVLVVLWLWKSKRKTDKNDQGHQGNQGTASQPETPLRATEIVACDICQVHLPRSEALPGPGGVYCSAAHRQQASSGQPPK
ncbi:MAG: hypothetical protein H7228_16240 [Polaromonas sp.]|nr:hypothetical protein [Polaromonas sp.]